VLADLAATAGESCNLGMLHGNEARYLDRVETARFPLKLDFRPGSCVPLYCSAMGKVFLSSMPPALLGRYLESVTLTAHTEETRTDPARLRDELDKVKELGFAQDDEEYVAGVNCLAVPVMVQKGSNVLALAIQAPKSRKDIDGLMDFLPALREAASRMSNIIEGEMPPLKPSHTRRDD
jgi:DNA-binding IclR family transcriptional regulator